MLILLSSSIVACFLLIWFKSEAWIEYCRLFHLNKISFYKDFDQKKKNDVTLTYHGYLNQYHTSFIVRLLTCPICSSIWVSILISIILNNFLLIPLSIIGGLLLFGTIHKLLN